MRYCRRASTHRAHFRIECDLPDSLSWMTMDLKTFKYDATIAQSSACCTLGFSSAIRQRTKYNVAA